MRPKNIILFNIFLAITLVILVHLNFFNSTAKTKVVLQDVKNIEFYQNSKYSTTKLPKKEKLLFYRRLPRVIAIGAKKCGTGALRFFLSKHSKVKVSYKDEPHFFDNSTIFKNNHNHEENIHARYVSRGEHDIGIFFG